jgi:signal transduction histidine kinase
VNRITDAGVRRGLAWLLLTSGGWATAHVGYLAGPTPLIQELFYIAGLIVGIAAVGPWLYFCAAYTGRSLHQRMSVQRTAVLVFLGIVSMKLTNPIHGGYYSTSIVSEPFPHLLVSHQPLHWVVMGLAYALALVGFFMLFELFLSVDSDVTALVVLVGVTGLPIAFNVAGFASESLLEITYSPLGVVIFAVGVMFVYLEPFQTVTLTANRKEPIIILSDGNTIRDFNRAALEPYPELEDAHGEKLSSVLPQVGSHLDESGAVLEVVVDEHTRYYRMTVTPFSADSSRLGSVASLTDITEQESYRRELERQNERLEQFASMVSHDLRNPLNVATLRAETALDKHEEDEDLAAVKEALDRMEVLIDDLLTLARQGQPIEETEPVSLSTIATQAWRMVDTTESELVVDGDRTFLVDSDRLQQLFENLFRNTIEHGGPNLTVQVGRLDDGSFFVADDGVGIPEDERESVFESGFTTSEDGTGFGLCIVHEIVDAHGWNVSITESENGGARFEIRGVETPGDDEQRGSPASTD